MSVRVRKTEDTNWLESVYYYYYYYYYYHYYYYY